MSTSTASPAPRTDWVALAERLGSGFATRAMGQDEEDRFATDNVAELRANRFYAAAVPAEFGGGDASIVQLSLVLRALGRNCGGTALAFSMHTHNVATAAWRWRNQNAPMETLLRRIADEQCVVVSSGGNDWLESGGTARRVEGGYRINARKPFVSGQPVGDLLSTSAVLDDPTEGPTVLHFFVPLTAPGLRVVDTWKVHGMRASGSNDIVLEEVFVPDAAIGGRRVKGRWHPLFHTISMIALPLIYSVYVGIAEAARDLVLKGVSEPTRRDPLMQAAAGSLDTMLATARMALADMLTATSGEPGPETTVRVTTGRQIAGEAAIRTVELAMEMAGGRGYFRAAGLERLFRDVQAARYHPLKTSDQRLLAGRLALGMPIDG